MTREENIKIFEETVEFSRKNGFKSKTVKFNTGDITRIKSYYTTNIRTINTDTVNAAQKYQKKGKTAILNMASYKRPGGGVKRGSQAQEECLFRCSNLIDAIPEDHYPLKPNEALYTYGAHFFRDFNYGFINPFTVDVITIPAYNVNKYQINSDSKEYEEGTKDKIRLMLYTAALNGVKNLILGAWGCGVYGNDPVYISKLFKKIIDKEYTGIFRNVIFAVINDSNSVGNNYHIFSGVLNDINFCEFDNKELLDILEYLGVYDITEITGKETKLAGDQIKEISWEYYDELKIEPKRMTYMHDPYPASEIFNAGQYLRMKRLIENIV